MSEPGHRSHIRVRTPLRAVHKDKLVAHAKRMEDKYMTDPTETLQREIERIIKKVAREVAVKLVQETGAIGGDGE